MNENEREMERRASILQLTHTVYEECYRYCIPVCKVLLGWYYYGTSYTTAYYIHTVY
jgi:hypothetical protein